MAASNPSRRAVALAVLILVGVFLAGLGAGLAGASLFERRGPHRPPPPRGHFEADSDALPPPFDTFGLDDAQRERARPLVVRHRAEMKALIDEVLPRVRATRGEFDQQMRAILTPEQTRQLDAFLADDRPHMVPGIMPPPPRP